MTEDWPELTTYFDAEIIGSRYGFLTRQWGASEQEDWVHWGRFPAFRHVKNELEKPHMTMKDADRGAVFMRWKEKFLVPDHRVQDISGASFAGENEFSSSSFSVVSQCSIYTCPGICYSLPGMSYINHSFSLDPGSMNLLTPTPFFLPRVLLRLRRLQSASDFARWSSLFASARGHT